MKTWKKMKTGDPIYILKYNKSGVEEFKVTKLEYAENYSSTMGCYLLYYYIKERAENPEFDGTGSFFPVIDLEKSIAEDRDNNRFSNTYFFSNAKAALEMLDEDLKEIDEQKRTLIKIYDDIIETINSI